MLKKFIRMIKYLKNLTSRHKVTKFKGIHRLFRKIRNKTIVKIELIMIITILQILLKSKHLHLNYPK
jgi:hypothetical protein